MATLTIISRANNRLVILHSSMILLKSNRNLIQDKELRPRVIMILLICSIIQMLEILCHHKLLSKKQQHKTSHKLLSSKITIQTCYLILVLTISSQKRKNKILIALLTLQQVSNRRRIKEVALHLILLPMWLNSNSQCLQFNQKRKFLTFRRMTFRRLVKRNMIWFLLSLTNRIIRAHP